MYTLPSGAQQRVCQECLGYVSHGRYGETLTRFCARELEDGTPQAYKVERLAAQERDLRAIYVYADGETVASWDRPREEQR